MKDLKPIKGRYHIASLIEQGEHESQDFKHSVNDASKIAHSLSAFANNKGGRLLIGVKDNGNIAGVRNEEDIYVIEQAASMYCRPAQQVDFNAYNVDNGTIVIVAAIKAAARRPVFAREHDGSWKAYYRVADENIVAHPLMVQAWQKMADDSAPAINFGAHHRAVLAAIETITAGKCIADVSNIARHIHLSMSTTRSIIVDLAALGLIEFDHCGQHFAIIPSKAP